MYSYMVGTMNRYLLKYIKISLESIHCIDLDGVGLNESGGVASGSSGDLSPGSKAKCF